MGGGAIRNILKVKPKHLLRTCTHYNKSTYYFVQIFFFLQSGNLCMYTFSPEFQFH